MTGKSIRKSAVMKLIISATLLVGSVAPAALAASGLAAAAYGLRAGRSRREVAVLATVTPLYAIGHALGMWRGAFELLRGGTAR